MKYMNLKKTMLLFLAVAGMAAVSACTRSGEAVFIPTETPCVTPEQVVFRVSETEEPMVPVLTATPEVTRKPVDGVYSFAWFSDTQHYCRQNNGVFECMTEFLKNTREELDLRYVVFTGDFVHNFDNEDEWAVADRAMHTIDELPHGALAGNHDVGTSADGVDYTYYEKYFGAERYAGRAWFGGNDRNNRSHYDLIDCGDTGYLFVYIGYPADARSVEWAKTVFDSHPERVGILCAHSYFNTDLSLSDDGVMLKEHLVDKCPNLYMVLCGHRYNSAVVPYSVDDDRDGSPDRTVLQMISNYQAIGPSSAPVRTGGDGYIRLLEIDETAGTLKYKTYSPLLDDYSYFDDPEHRKEKYAFGPESEQGEIRLPWVR